jgi:magnesium-transporting ATPase (P-type)
MADITGEKKMHWHAMDSAEVLKELSTDPEKGLNQKEYSQRLEKHGKNKLPERKSRSWWMSLLSHFHNVLIYILLAAAIITALMDHWIDTWVILAVVVINAVIGYIQEGKAERALEGIRKMLSLEAIVIRDGKKTSVDAEDLVPGDITLLKSGDKVPADIRLIEVKDLRVEESPLTGESTAVDKLTEKVDTRAIIGDQLSMAFSGTVITYGKAKGVVVATGSDTEIGKINKMISDVKKITTPLLQQIERFGKWLSLIIVIITAAFFAYGVLVQGYELNAMFLAAIGLIVAAIPEGLPAIMTITLAIGVQRMAKRNAIIRRLPSVETLGAVDVICSDKTGTLTKNEMTAQMVITAEKEYTIQGTGYNPQGEIHFDGKKIDPRKESVLWQLLQAIRISNNAELTKDESGHWKVVGAPTEGALLTLSHKAGLKDLKTERIDQIPFESEHKYMATLNQIQDRKYIFLTGAPERLLDLCSHQYTEKGEEDINHSYWEKKIEEIAEKGQRMLGAAFAPAEKNRKEIAIGNLGKDIIFLGLIGIMDPPRDEAISAIKECKEAGVSVKMITGDHAITAKAIGKQIGIGDGIKVLTGKDLEEMSDEEMQRVVNDHDIYARTSPEHKLRLVKALQANGRLCAMTGDGVNDAPALKMANIGIAMGIKGTEVTKDASEMVLADDNFASIVNAIEEGRTVYDNIRKALLFILPTNGAESLVIMAAILLGMVMPITPAQILWVNMVTAVTLALAISFEPMEEEVMTRPPRKAGESILGPMFIWRIVFVSLLIGGMTLFMFNYMKTLGFGEQIARTVAVNTLVAGQLFYLFNCRRIKQPGISRDFFNNKYVFIAAGALILLQLGFVYLPLMNTFFGTQPLDIWKWMYAAGAGLIVFVLVETEKLIIRKFFP